ncbi:hypothetical protein [Ralstonia phage RSF1]|uniref:Uncharacterized protein n=1 Tax=Ralstonia phage RSF1 TaxID=1689679 RepID=A0A146I5Q6_9CAUD|nr:hypothetical protein AVU11_agp27 [Ralstonia phage RSF1]BAU71418.1 hypothetical protein [Ralstonia phage RSF1]
MGEPDGEIPTTKVYFMTFEPRSRKIESSHFRITAL